MRIEATPWGNRIWIKNAADERSYEIRNVRPLNEWHARLHPCIDDLEDREKKLERRLLILLHQLERCIEDAYAEPCGVFIERWEKHNHLSFNEWFHDQIRELIEQIDGISEEYCIHATEDGYGWSY